MKDNKFKTIQDKALYAKKRDHKIDITDVAINKIPRVQFKGFSDMESDILYQLSVLVLWTSLNENNDKVNLKEKNIIVNLDNKDKTKKTSNGFYTIKVNKNEIKNNIKLKKDKNDDKNNNRNSIININNINMISENKKFLGLKRINNNESNAQSKITVITIDDSSSSDSDSSFDSICISSSINK